MAVSPQALEDLARAVIRERHRQADQAALLTAARAATHRSPPASLRRLLVALRGRLVR